MAGPSGLRPGIVRALPAIGCGPVAPGDRPTEFTAEKGTNQRLVTWKWVKQK